jgi:hypothetical protein
MPVETSGHHPGACYCRFLAEVAFLGAHFKKVEDIKFADIWIKFSYLDDWLQISGFKKICQCDEEFTVEYRRPKDLLVNINKNLQICIVFALQNPGCDIFRAVQNEVHVKQEAWIGVIPSGKRSLEDLLPTIYQIQNFLTMATAKLVYPLSIKCRTEHKEEEKSVSVFYRISGIEKPAKLLGQGSMLFPFKTISKQFPFLLRNWFKKGDSLGPVYSLYFGALYAPEMYPTNKFLNIIQAIESFHRRTMKNYELKENQHQKRIADILNLVPVKYKDWLSKQLNYSNEPNLRKRLKEILSLSPKALLKIIDSQEAFIQKILDTRNYLTHYDPHLKDKAAKGEELLGLTLKLIVVLQSLLLREIGFSSETTERLVTNLVERGFRLLVQSPRHLYQIGAMPI